MVIVIALFVFCIAVQVFFWLKFRRVISDHSPSEEGQCLPYVTIIVCAKDEEENIESCIQSLLVQQYRDFEIIVVDDYSSDSTPMIISRIKKQYPDVVKSFIPQKDVPGKKAAIEEAINFAKGEWIMLTDADCEVKSPHWVEQMVSKIDQQTVLILGYSPYESQNTLVNKVLRYETFYIALQYFTKALKGNAYMGVGRNLAFSKSAFLENRPFSTNPTGPGDDDAIVLAIANSSNSKVSLTSKSFVHSKVSESFSWRDYFKKKKRHISPYENYASDTKAFLMLLGFSHVGVYLFGIIVAFYHLIFVGVLLAFRWLVMILTTERLKNTFQLSLASCIIPAMDFLLMSFYVVQVLFLPIQKNDW